MLRVVGRLRLKSLRSVLAASWRMNERVKHVALLIMRPTGANDVKQFDVFQKHQMKSGKCEVVDYGKYVVCVLCVYVYHGGCEGVQQCVCV